MPTLSSYQHTAAPTVAIEATRAKSVNPFASFVSGCLAILFLVLALAITGCGSGGYAGGGISSISASAVTIDAGQSFAITSQENGTDAVGWTLSGTSCSAATCGSLSSQTGLATTYTAPSGLTTQLLVTLTASITGTQNKKVVSITINPDPVISGTPPHGVVGVAYSATLTASGGTGTLKWSQASGQLPAGLTFNTATGVISGTPTAVGTSAFVAQVVDASDVPYTTQARESISVTTTAASLALTGNPPSGTVGAAYSTALIASGGVAPYSFSVLSGALPGGLTLSSPTGVISGTPTASGTFSFMAQVQDASGTQVAASFSITIGNGAGVLTLTTATLPNGTVGVPYSATIGVAGGTAPYSCVFTAGTLPAGLSLTGCVVSGTPTAATTASLTVKATDSANPAATGTGPETITIVAAPSLVITSPPSGTVGAPYTGTIPVAGGTAPYTCAITAGTLPSGLSLSGCVISGTPTVAGASPLTIKATDSNNPATTSSGPITLTIAPAALAVTTGTLPNGTVGVAYSSTIGVSGGTAPYNCVFTTGTLPAGLTLGANCLVSGTPTAAGTSSLTVNATDSGNPTLSATGPVGITIVAAPVLTITSPPSGTVGTPYTGQIPVSGGTGPYTCKLSSGTLEAGLSLGTNCVITGTPTAPGAATVVVQATDSKSPATTSTGSVTVIINPASLAITTGALPNGTVGVAYSSTVGVTGGTAPYTCTFTSGTLPAGLTLGPNCLVAGTPTVSGTVSLLVKATDSSNPTLTASGPVSLTIAPAPVTLTPGNPPPATIGQPYTGTIPIVGGAGPYQCTLLSGALPVGLSLGTNCTITGTPTGGSGASPIIGVTDSGNPPATGSGPITISLNPALAITTGTLPNGTVGVAYSATIGVSNGTAPYTCTITSGTLPAGLSLGANCLVSGTPTVAVTANLVVKATDSSNPTLTATGPVSVTINPAPLAVATGTLPNGTVGVAYSSAIGVTGGTAPYTCTFTSGTLPAGLTLGANCLVSGTPTVATTATLTVKATDSSNPALSASGPVSITIVAAPVTLTPGNPPAGTVGTPYTGVIPVSGGTAPYTCTLTSGTLPAGLTLTNCTLTGTPTTPGTSPVVITVGDSSNPPAAGSGTVTITIGAATPVLTLGNPPAATVGTPYTGIIPVTGGTGPYTCTLNSGIVPAGLTLNNCTLTGTPTAPGSPILNITATDSSNPKGTTTGNVTVTVNPIPPLTLTGSLPNAILGTPYTQTLHAAGGIAPYTYALTAGALPAGLTLSTTGVISGTPTVIGASSFTVTATDTETTPQTASLPLVILVTYPVTATDSELKGPYAFLFQGYDDALAGVLAYQTATVGSFTADGVGGIANGELDSNHQTSNPAGATVVSRLFLGTYTLGADNRGSLTLTTLNADGTTAQTTTYAISVKAPIAPATTTAQGSLIEFDSNQLRGTKGSGTLLQQTAASLTTGLAGSYAFGLSGDTPCLPTCTVGIVAGPVASVGQFTVDGNGNITSGTSDSNIANVQFTDEALTGSYGTADGNGRVQLSLTTGGTPAGVYPTDYAVYLVNSNQAFLVSTDKHSAAILLAGSAQSQTLNAFANTSLTGPFVGYENAATNPGLVGATLANVANLSTATIFRATADAAGTCNVTNVDVGGATQLVNGLTGLGSGAPILNALLGTYQSTGTAACTVSSNGRGILNYPVPNTVLSGTLGLLGLPTTPPPARVVYLAAADRGYFLETGYAGLGQIEPQTGAPFAITNFNGTYVYGEAPASSAVTINASGFITANGAGAATSTEDLNLGVGTLNVLQLGVTHNETYTAPDSTSGRFLLNDTTVIDTSVVYILSPGRFVLLDTNPATTSPSVNILY